MSGENKKRVVVLGAGFGGLEFCKTFRHEDAEIILVDRQNHHLFQPLLYQVATAGLSPPEIAQPIRSILSKRKDITVLMDEAVRIDLDSRRVHCKQQTLAYDYLIIGLGVVTSYFGHPEWAEHATGLKSLSDAIRIRSSILHAFELAEMEFDPGKRRKLMTIVVVGGGPTGVELAGAFAELARHVLRRDFRRIDSAGARIILIESSAHILENFDSPLPDKARAQLEALGVEVRTSCKVEDLGAGFVKAGGDCIEAENIIWGAGVAAHPITRTLGIELARGGRIPVLPDLTLPGHPEVFAVGDIVSLTDSKGVTVPGVSPGALQMGAHVAKLLRAEMEGTEAGERAFTYRDKGSMATIGRSAAIAQVAGLKFSGFSAWLLWLFVHLIFLVGLRNKIVVLVQWFYSYVRYKRGARIITEKET
jgi:NADH:ubiquinone reductase (H+-translocating)